MCNRDHIRYCIPVHLKQSLPGKCSLFTQKRQNHTSRGIYLTNQEPGNQSEEIMLHLVNISISQSRDVLISLLHGLKIRSYEYVPVLLIGSVWSYCALKISKCHQIHHWLWSGPVKKHTSAYSRSKSNTVFYDLSVLNRFGHIKISSFKMHYTGSVIRFGTYW
jgi:hypothetical protein